MTAPALRWWWISQSELRGPGVIIAAAVIARTEDEARRMKPWRGDPSGQCWPSSVEAVTVEPMDSPVHPQAWPGVWSMLVQAEGAGCA